MTGAAGLLEYVTYIDSYTKGGVSSRLAHCVSMLHIKWGWLLTAVTPEINPMQRALLELVFRTSQCCKIKKQQQMLPRSVRRTFVWRLKCWCYNAYIKSADIFLCLWWKILMSSGIQSGLSCINTIIYLPPYKNKISNTHILHTYGVLIIRLLTSYWGKCTIMKILTPL